MAIATPAQLTQISNLYVSLFNRAPDTAGLSFWSAALANGANIGAIAQGFLTAPEGQTNYPQFQTASDFVTALYTKVFGRAPDASGLAFWTAALNGAGGANSDAAKAAVVSQIVSIVSTPLTARPEGLTDAQYAQTVNDRALFANKVEVGTYVATQTPVSVDAAKLILVDNAGTPLVTADPATVITAKAAANIYGTALSNAVTNGTALVGSGSADYFTISATDLGTADGKTGFSLDGGAGVDTLAITGAATITDAVKNVTNVENITFNATSTVAAAKFVGATTFSNLGGDLTLTGLAAGQGVAVSGGDKTDATYVAGANAAALTVSGGTTGVGNGASSGNVTFAGTGLTSATIKSAGNAANTVGTINLGGTIGAVTIDAATNLTAVLSNAKAGATLTINGGGAIALGALPTGFTTVNAGAATGGLSASIGAAVTSLTGSSAVDKITVTGDLAPGTVINLGAGNDALLTDGGTIAAGSTIDAGAGIDMLSSKLVTSANAAVFKNFDLLQIDAGTIIDAAQLTGSTLTGLVVAGGANTNGSAVNNVASTVGLTVTGEVASGTTTIGVKDAATNTADTYTVTLANATAGTAAAAGTIGLAGVETINIVSAGTVGATNGVTNSNSIDISDAALKTLNITGSQAATVTFSTATTATSLIDGSAATGSLNIDTTNVVSATVANGGLTIKGGTAADSLTIGQTALVTGGAGNDTFVLSSTAIQQEASPTLLTIAAKLVTITDFAKGDVIDFLGNVAGTGGTTITLADQTGATDLLAAVNAVVADNGSNTSSASTIEAFRFGGDTYIVNDVSPFVSNDGGANGGINFYNNGTFGAGDTLIKLSGIVDLTNVVANAATGEVFFGTVPA